MPSSNDVNAPELDEDLDEGVDLDEVEDTYEEEVDYGDPHDWDNYDPPEDEGPDTYSWRE